MTEADKFLAMLRSKQELAYDVETNGLNRNKCYVCGYSLSDGQDAFYVPVRHEGGENISNVDEFESTVNEIIRTRKHKLIGHNIKFDKHFSSNHGIDLGQNIGDTMVYAALLDENKFSYSLKNVCKGYDIAQKKDEILYAHLSELFGVKADRNSMGHYYRTAGNDAIAVEYAKGDTLSTYQLYQCQKKDLYAQQLDVVVGLEDNLISTLARIEKRGVRVDIDAVSKLKEEIDQLQTDAYSNIPLTENLETINVKSGKDLQKYFEYLNITDWPVTDKGNPSFNKTYLKGMEEGEAILHARKLDHFTSSFLDPLDNLIHKSRIYTNFNQTAGEFGGTKTGRLSSYGPNMQQIPKRDKFIGKRYRKIFIPDDGYVIIEFDYSQAEPRLFSHYSREPILIKGYNSTPFIDMHAVAAEMMGISRDVAKNLNLGMMYAMGAMKLAISLGITYEEAKTIVKKWYKTFPRVGVFTKSAAERAEQRGYVKTILGRRARFPDLRFSYKAANRIVQGGSADILKWKLVELDRWLIDNDLEDIAQMLLNIHDSVVMQIREDRLDLIPLIVKLLEDVQVEPFNLSIPFVADYKPASKNWSDATYGI